MLVSDRIEDARRLVAYYDVCKVTQPDRFGFTQRSAGPLTLSHICSSEMVLTHRPNSLTAGNRRFALQYVRRGRLAFLVDGQIRLAEAGEVMLVDHGRTFGIEVGDGLDCLSVTLPERWLLDRTRRAETMAFGVVGASQSWSRTVRAILDEWNDLAYVPGPMLAEQLGGLLGLMLGNGSIELSGPRSRITQEIINHIHSSLAEPNVAPRDIAFKIGIAVRSLHALLASAGTSFGRELMQARVSGARLVLSNPAYRHLSVAEIAYMHGFLDPGHFARRFRIATGETPTAFRMKSISDAVTAYLNPSDIGSPNDVKAHVSAAGHRRQHGRPDGAMA